MDDARLPITLVGSLDKPPTTPTHYWRRRILFIVSTLMYDSILAMILRLTDDLGGVCVVFRRSMMLENDQGLWWDSKLGRSKRTQAGSPRGHCLPGKRKLQIERRKWSKAKKGKEI